MPLLTTQETRELYQRLARHYDRAVLLLRAAGFREQGYRVAAVNALSLRQGDTVVELGCGTGRNFELLESAVGVTGKVVGVDLTGAMLDQAEARIHAAGWTNVQLVEHDMAKYAIPSEVDGVLSTFALTLVPEYQAVVARGGAALRRGGRLVVLDFKEPAHWPAWLVRFGAWANRPFGVSLELAARHPCESIRRELNEVVYQEFYAGAVYVCAGERDGSA
jgi:ubiquinone/menaquinone biosynthesis C-methylase UbiE